MSTAYAYSHQQEHLPDRRCLRCERPSVLAEENPWLLDFNEKLNSEGITLKGYTRILIDEENDATPFLTAPSFWIDDTDEEWAQSYVEFILENVTDDDSTSL